VLDRLLDHQSIDLFGVTGTSAGAMNAVVLAYTPRPGWRTTAPRSA
jgi:hypothetical protein